LEFTLPNIYSNQQYFPLRTADTSTAVGNTDDILGDLVTATTDEAVFQYDSNPIVARISTNKEFGIDAAEFGTTSITDRFSLAVYETEPVVSALDIYWETSQAGLISDINTEVLTGFDGPVAFDGITDLLNENLTNPSPATTYFRPILSNGTDLPAGFTITLDNVIDSAGTGSIVPSRFTLVQNPADSKEYRVETTDVFYYQQNSSTVDRFQFNCTVSDPTSTWQTAQLSFILDLTNSAPSLDPQDTSPSQEYYYFFEDSTTSFKIRNFLTENTSRNGSADTFNNTAQLRWDLGGPDAALFILGITSGVLSPSAAGVAAGLNTYEITVTLTDAAYGAGALSVTQTYFIVKGYEPSNIGNTQGDTLNEFFNFNPASPGGLRESSYHAWYISDSTLTASDLPPYDTFWLASRNYDTFPIGSREVKRPPVNISSNKLLAQGGFIFGVEESDITNLDLGTSCTAPVTGDLAINVYYRDKGSSTWNIATDLNNTNSLEIDYKNFNTLPLGNDRGYAFFAQERNQYSSSATGIEFAFIAKTAGDDNSGLHCGTYGNSIGMSGKIILRDLHYTGASQTQQTYQYKIYEGGGASTAAGATKTGATEYIYADNPLAENVEKFFTGTQVLNGTTDFATIYTPPSTLYYVVELEWGPAASSGPPGGLTHDRNGLINQTSGSNVVDRFATTIKIDGTTGLIDRSLIPVAASDGYQLSFKSRGTITTDQTNTYFDTL
jgi:hypothetical protein